MDSNDYEYHEFDFSGTCNEWTNIIIPFTTNNTTTPINQLCVECPLERPNGCISNRCIQDFPKLAGKPHRSGKARKKRLKRRKREHKRRKQNANPTSFETK